MAWYNTEEPDTLNFMLIGNHFSGYGLLQSCLAAHPQMVCHGELFNSSEAVRKREHEKYFGATREKCTDFFVPKAISAEQYLNCKIFDNTLRGEKAVGVKVGYEIIQYFDLWDYIDQKCRQGDFCVLHVKRNPVACFVAKQQRHEAKALKIVSTVVVDQRKLTDFCRNQLSVESKIDKLCPDRASLCYYELLLGFRAVLTKLCAFLELDFFEGCVPVQLQVKRQSVQSRVSNWTELRKKVPSDILELMDDPCLY
jgi:hypothetical protein